MPSKRTKEAAAQAAATKVAEGIGEALAGIVNRLESLDAERENVYKQLLGLQKRFNTQVARFGDAVGQRMTAATDAGRDAGRSPRKARRTSEKRASTRKTATPRSGDHRLDFSRPLAQRLPRAQVKGRMGDINLENLGNARALAFKTSSRMGNVNVDLGGDWPVGTVSELVFNHSMGDLRLNVPETVRIAADSESVATLGESGTLGTVTGTDDLAAPVVRLDVSTIMGETRFRRY